MKLTKHGPAPFAACNSLVPVILTGSNTLKEIWEADPALPAIYISNALPLNMRKTWSLAVHAHQILFNMNDITTLDIFSNLVWQQPMTVG